MSVGTGGQSLLLGHLSWSKYDIILGGHGGVLSLGDKVFSKVISPGVSITLGGCL